MIKGFYAVVEDANPDRLEMLLGAGARVVQFRNKEASSAALVEAARNLQSLIAGRATFIVNDRPDIAMLANADGVHLGQEDMSLSDAKAIVGGRIVGISTHSLKQAVLAAAQGADYLGFGPIFGTQTKQRPDRVVGLQQLKQVCSSVRIPVVAIGGITPFNVSAVVEAGAAAAASIAGVLSATDIEQAARAIAAAFEAAPATLRR